MSDASKAVGERRRFARVRRAALLVGQRTALGVPLTLIVSLATFGLAALAPFDPLAAYLGSRYERTSMVQREALARELGLNDHWWAIWWRWLEGVVTRWDWGQSRSMAQPVAQVLSERLPWTMLLAGVALLLAVLASLGLGVAASLRPGSWVARFSDGLAQAVQACPPFVLALAAIAVFSVGLHWLPVAGVAENGTDPTWGSILRHIILPAIVLAVSFLPWLLLNVTTSVSEALRQDHVAAARRRGLSRQSVVWRHALPGALLPFITVIGARLPELVTGAVLVEAVFSWPGLASATVTAATSGDFPLLAAVTTVTCAAVLVGSIFADAAALLLDPRIVDA